MTESNLFNEKENRQERLEFVKKWAEYVRTHSDKDWSKQQKIVIDSQYNLKQD